MRKLTCDLNVYKLLVLSFCWAQNQNQLTFFITVISFGNPYVKIYVDLFLQVFFYLIRNKFSERGHIKDRMEREIFQQIYQQKISANQERAPG